MLNCQRLKGRLARHLWQYVLKACSCAVPSVEQARPVGVYAVYAQETDHQREKRQLAGCYTTEPVTNAVQATIALVYLRWHVKNIIKFSSAAKLKVIG